MVAELAVVMVVVFAAIVGGSLGTYLHLGAARVESVRGFFSSCG